jgi:hypothetical protein
MIRLGSPETFVIHITAYPNDPKVTQHIVDVHSGAGSTRTALVSKLEITWSRTLMQQVRSYLFGNLVRAKITKLFGSVGGPESRYTDLTHSLQPSAGNSMTHDLRDLLESIVEHWDDLDDPLKRNIKEYFVVAEAKGGERIQISLL